jgi:hypothetical protein
MEGIPGDDSVPEKLSPAPVNSWVTSLLRLERGWGQGPALEAYRGSSSLVLPLLLSPAVDRSVPEAFVGYDGRLGKMVR